MAMLVIVGAGQAAATAVEHVRREGYADGIVLVGDEGELPYQRPPLSKKYLAGELPAERVAVKALPFYETAKVELRLGVRASALDAKARRLTLADGSQLHFDALLLATGARARRIEVEGAQLPGIHYLRSKADADAIRAEFPKAKRVVVVGAGYIGLEVAATCRSLGLEVTVLELAERVMNRVVAPELSAFYAAEHARAGVDIRLGTGLQGFVGRERVQAVATGHGEIAADLVIVGIGVVPNVELAKGAGLELADGIAIDANCRSSHSAIYAAGDCASQVSARYGRRVRLESVDNAFEQAKTAAANIAGREHAHDKIPWFWSDQFDLKLLIVGLSAGHDRVIVRGDPARRAFSLCYLAGNELLALDAVNVPKDYMAAKTLIHERARFDLARLADPAVPLKEARA
jgi:3-phenylpropionate/trans-cinnamate dioxygenase ferredoxin reductase component